MKNYKTLKLLCFTILALFINQSCEDYLEFEPKGLLIPQDIEHYEGLFNVTTMTSYVNVSPGTGGFSFGIGGGADANLAVVLSGESLLVDPFSTSLIQRYRNAYTWSDEDLYLPGEDAPEWEVLYTRMYTYNLIIEEVMDAEGGTEAQKRALLAEARANRALLHFMVLNFFSKPYNAATAASDPGVPIIREPNATVTGNTRGTVQEVYDFIINELTEAMPDLPEQTVSRLRLARAAGKYILGRVYLFMGEYENALAELNDCKALISNSLVPIRLYDYNVMMPLWQFSPFFPPVLPNPNVDEEGIFQQTVSLIGLQSSVFIDPATESMYDASDLRYSKLFGTKAFFGPDTAPNKSRVAPNFVNYGPSVPDLYLMIAECKARTGDVAGAKTDLETFRASRMSAAAATVTATEQDDVIREIIDERLREYACTGMFWFDIRRLWDDPVFDNTFSHTDIDGTEYQLTEERLVLRIPPEILQFNPDWEDNP